RASARARRSIPRSRAPPRSRASSTRSTRGANEHCRRPAAAQRAAGPEGYALELLRAWARGRLVRRLISSRSLLFRSSRTLLFFTSQRIASTAFSSLSNAFTQAFAIGGTDPLFIFA